MAEPKTPAENPAKGIAARQASSAEVNAFIEKVRAMTPAASGRGRLIFAMDATMSRQPTWDLALKLQGDMFQAVKDVGGLDVQLVYFRGFNETKASKWIGDPDAVARLMSRVACEGGYTQIQKVLSHARGESAATRVNALVYVGDAMEENIDELAQRAGDLRLLGVPCFMFQEGYDKKAERAFKEIAKLTRGAYCRFDSGSASQLGDLLKAVAVYATGGRKALKDFSQATRSSAGSLLLEQLS